MLITQRGSILKSEKQLLIDNSFCFRQCWKDYDAGSDADANYDTQTPIQWS